MLYKRLCVGLDDKGRLVPKDEVFEHILDSNKDHYISVFDYNDEHVAKFKEVGTVSGITDVVTDTLVFDFDSASDLNLAKNDTLELCSRLIKLGIDATQLFIAFSGSKGFTVEVHSASTFIPQELKKTCLNLGKDLVTLDNQIYNASRILRVPFTKHQKTGLFKTPLTLDELSNLTIEQIQELAADPSGVSITEYVSNVPLSESILKLKNIDPEIRVDAPPVELMDLDLSAKPKGMPACKYAILHGFFKQGHRSHALMALSAHFKAQGFPKEVTYRLLKGAVELQERRYPTNDPMSSDEIWLNIIGQVYSPNWKGATYACKDHAFLQASCPVRNTASCGLNKKEPIVSIADVSSVFKRYATDIDKNTVKLGIESLDKQIRLQSNSHVVIAGCSGSGKTSIVLNILNNHSNAGLKGVFCSMDMGAPLIYQKLAHKVSGLNDKQLYSLYKNNSPQIEEIDRQIVQQYKNIMFDFRAGVDIDNLRENVLSLKEKHGAELKLVVLDFINRIRGPYSDETSNLAYIAPRLADLANESETLIISLAQTARSKGGPAEPLKDSRISKGSSAIEESASVLFGIYRNGYNTDMDKFITVAALKTRMGKEFSQPLFWNGLTGEIRDLTANEDFELDQLEEAKKAEKNSKDASQYD